MTDTRLTVGPVFLPSHLLEHSKGASDMQDVKVDDATVHVWDK